MGLSAGFIRRCLVARAFMPMSKITPPSVGNLPLLLPLAVHPQGVSFVRATPLVWRGQERLVSAWVSLFSYARVSNTQDLANLVVMISADHVSHPLEYSPYEEIEGELQKTDTQEG